MLVPLRAVSVSLVSTFLTEKESIIWINRLLYYLAEGMVQLSSHQCVLGSIPRPGVVYG